VATDDAGGGDREYPARAAAIGRGDTKVERRAARALVGKYHEAKLAELVEHVREALGARYDAGEIDVIELDDVIHRYRRAAREL
jgi:hypothetical protein